MTTELVLAEQMSFSQLAELTGQQVNKTTDFLPRMIINRESENDDGQAVPPGTYKIYGGDKEAVYSKNILFRPYVNTYFYSKYDAVTEKYVNKSIQIKQWEQEAIDELGGVRCGKIPSKKAINLTEAQVANQKAIKCYRNLFGTLTLTGINASGDNVILEEYPVLWRSTGSAFAPVGDALQILTKAKRASFTHQLDMSLTRAKQGSNVYYIPEIKVDLSKYRAMNEGDMELLKKFQESIDFENSQVIEKYKKSKNNEAIADVADDIMDAGFLDLNNTSETFHNDEMPF